MREVVSDRSPLRTRAAQFGWLSVALAGLAIGLLTVAAARVINQGQGLDLNRCWCRSTSVSATPVARCCRPRRLLVASTFGLAGLQTAAVMRVLDPDRHIRRHRRRRCVARRAMMLGPSRRSWCSADEATSAPPTALPTSEVLPAGTDVRCTVLIPAHNEEAILGADVGFAGRADASPGPGDRGGGQLHRRAPSRWRAAHQVEVVETVGNTEKKAGALNQQLSRLLPGAEPRDVVMVMDADSTLAPEFLEVALGLMEARPGTGRGGRAVLRRGRRSAGRPVPAQRVHPVPAAGRPQARSGVRPDRDGVGDPRLRAACGRRGARSVAAGAGREGLRHAAR